MPLNIDIAFRWLQKKKKQEEEEEKKKRDEDTTSQTTSQTTTDETSVTGETSESSSSSSESASTDDDESTDDDKMSKYFNESTGKRSERKKPTEQKDILVDVDESKVPTQVGVCRRVIFARHAERMDSVFPAWHRLANVNEEYMRYDTNQPVELKERLYGLTAMSNDPPITNFGRMEAQSFAKSLKNHYGDISAIYCSPALRCLQTATVVYSEILRKNGKEKSPPMIRVEPALFDYLGWYVDGLPIWMSKKEMVDAEFPIDVKYKHVISRDQILHSRAETKHDYYRRSSEFIQRMLSKESGSILIVGHATTMDSASRSVLHLPRSVPTSRQMDTMCLKYPYCSSVVVEQFQDYTGKGQWRIGSNLTPIIALGENSGLDFKFLFRK